MLQSLIARYGYLAVGLGTFLEGETVLVVAGALAHKGLLGLPGVMLAAFLGSLSGDQLWFFVGRRFGARLLARRPRLHARARRVEQALGRHGTPFVLGFRFLYGLRTATPLLLGTFRYPAARFAVLNSAGAALWALTFGAGGWLVGAGLSSVLGRAAHLEEMLAVALVVVLAAAWAIGRLRI